MKNFTLVEEILHDSGIPSLCLKADRDIVDVDPEEKAGTAYELMIPKNPAKSVMAVLQQNKKDLDRELGAGKYFLKLRSFNYYFSYQFFKDYDYKDGLKSFLSISTIENTGANGELELILKIIVIGKPENILSEEIEIYFYDKLSKFNSEIRFVKVVSCLIAFKADPIVLIGEPEPEFEELPLDPLLHNIEFNKE